MARLPVQRVVALVSKGVGWVRRRPRPGLRILMYHAVDDVCAGAGTADRFRAQMAWLRREPGLSVVSLDDGLRALAHGDVARTFVAVTFDDGYADLLTVAAPILAAHGIPFTAFVVGGFLSGPPRPRRYLDRVGLRDLAAMAGATIGAHGHTHRPLRSLPPAELRSELTTSRAVLGEVLGRAPVHLSYPHGAVDDRVVSAAVDSGFLVGATSLIGANGSRVSRLRLRRTEIMPADDMAAFAGKIRGDFDWYRVKQRLYWPVPAASEQCVASAATTAS